MNKLKIYYCKYKICIFSRIIDVFGIFRSVKYLFCYFLQVGLPLACSPAHELPANGCFLPVPRAKRHRQQRPPGAALYTGELRD